jgi:cytochrome P450
MLPINAIAAASHRDPYPYYQHLREGPELVFDAELRLWIASRAQVIRDVMANPHCLVRPAGEAVPRAIAGSSAGAIFGQLARMNEGAAHAQSKLSIEQMLAALDLVRVARRSTHFAALLDASDGDAMTRWIFDLPTYVVADLLGVGEAELPQVALLMADFVRCLSPLSTPEQLASASTAAQALMERFAPVMQAANVCPANRIGLLSQTHEATAGLIGNSIVALLRDPALQARLRADPSQAAALVHDVARDDPAVQNTRRFVAQATSIAGVDLQPGDTILLLLGAAGQCGFGHGRHACPGQELACTIATAALEYLLARPHPLALDWTYKASANARLPQFFTKGHP